MKTSLMTHMTIMTMNPGAFLIWPPDAVPKMSRHLSIRGCELMSTGTANVFVGWHREDRRSPWRPIVEAESEDGAFRQLLDAARGGDKCILPRGIDPNETAPKARRRRF